MTQHTRPRSCAADNKAQTGTSSNDLIRPLRPAGQRVVRDVMCRLTPRRWYHSGLAGREVGDLLLPPALTARRDFDAERAPERGFTRVFVTDGDVLARRFAGVTKRRIGLAVCVYVVEPQGELELDHECPRRSGLHLATCDCVTSGQPWGRVSSGPSCERPRRWWR